MILSACGGVTAAPTPSITPRPSSTPTPRSTELPPVPTQILPGTSERPLKIGVIGESSAATTRLLRDLSRAFTAELENFRLGFYQGLTIEFVLLDDEQEALYLLCNSDDTAVFADAFTFIAAEKRCGAQPALQVQRDGESGSTFDLILNRTLQIFRLDRIVGRPFCTMSFDDLNSYIHPALAFKAAGVDPLDDFEVIIYGFKDEAEMILALSGRFEPGSRPRCAAAALPKGMINEVREELLDESREEFLTEQQFNNLITVLEPEEADQWQPIPYPILVFPPDRLYPSYLREQVITAFINLQEDEGKPQQDLQDLIPHDTLQPVTAADYDDFRDWLNRAGWDMAASALN